MGYLARLYKKKREYDKAIPLWRDITKRGDSLTPFIELAMFYEHIEKDFQEAIHWTLSAIDISSQQLAAGQSSGDLQQLNHRLSRLKKKLSKSLKST
jgi:hypothetical protein